MAWIYVIKNNINDKLYVGKTEIGIDERFKKHISAANNGSKYAIHCAMRKYGIEHFWPELIEETDNPNEREIYWIEKFGTYERGYNETRGGEGTILYDRDCIIEAYRKIGTKVGVAKELGANINTVQIILNSFGIYATSKIRMYDTNMDEVKMFNSLQSAAEYIIKEGRTKASLSSVKKIIGACCNGKRKTVYGYTYEYIDNGAYKNTHTRTFHEIIQSDLDGNFIAKYNSYTEAAKAVGGNSKNIHRCCIGQSKTYKNFKWGLGTEVQCGTCRPVFQTEISTGKILKRWDSISEAEKALGIGQSHIGKVCRKKEKSAGGFGWRYADEMELAA